MGGWTLLRREAEQRDVYAFAKHKEVRRADTTRIAGPPGLRTDPWGSAQPRTCS